MPTAEVRTHGHWLLPVVYTAAITIFSCALPTPKPLSNGHDPTITVAVAAGPLLDSEIETILVEWLRKHGYGAHVVIRRLSSEELLAFQLDDQEVVSAKVRAIGAANLLLASVIDYPRLPGRKQIALMFDTSASILRMTTLYIYCSRCADTWVRIRLGAALRDLFLGDRVPSDACIDEVACSNH
jgi:hypothetical protein